MTFDPASYEKLGAFYLGRSIDPAGGAPSGEPLLYDSKDLVTHAVCLGMTGSGKTGLGIGLIEEAALDGVPALVIDPKGDMTNLLLTFPALSGEDFEPWVDPAEAVRQGLSLAEHAAGQAELWRRGLAEWGQSGERIARLRDAAEFAVYTPGSRAGIPLSVLSSFAVPPPAVTGDDELLAERVATTARSLLGLVGIEADPVRSREHILLATLLDRAWRAGRGLDLGSLIQLVQDPGVDRVGVLPLDSFYPARERFELAMALNNLLAAPGFAGWLEGEPLDVDRLLYGPSGKPRVSVLSIAHLADAERMFFVSLLLSQVLGWMRGRPGTGSLRAILYMDEIFGYLPPVANPPSKQPMLTLLKQARAYGLGLVLATQNPVDLDYKALSNIGTWFLGRLQTERDKARLLDGLEAVRTGESGLDRAAVDRLLSGLDKRVFLLHDVHEDGPELFQTRWVMSYLRGPLTRAQIARLAAGSAAAPSAAAAPPVEGVIATAPASAAAAPPAPPSTAAAAARSRPVLPPEVEERFLPLFGRPGGDVVYRPHLVGTARVHFVDTRRDVDHAEEVALLAPLGEDAAVDWYAAAPLDPALELERRPAAGVGGSGGEEAGFAPLPGAAAEPRSYRGWEKELAEALYRGRRLELFTQPELGVVSRPGEGERELRIRLAEAARERRDREVESLRERHGKKAATLADRKRRAEHKVEREREQAQHQKMQTAVSFGATLLGAVFGRKLASRSNVGRATTAFRGVGRSLKEAKDIGRAEEDLAAIDRALAELEAELETEVKALEERLDPQSVELEMVTVKPRRSDIEVRGVALAWAPYRTGGGAAAEPAWG